MSQMTGGGVNLPSMDGAQSWEGTITSSVVTILAAASNTAGAYVFAASIGSSSASPGYEAGIAAHTSAISGPQDGKTLLYTIQEKSGSVGGTVYLEPGMGIYAKNAGGASAWYGTCLFKVL